MQNKSIVFIVAQNNFRDEELFEPRELLISRGVSTKIASRTTDVAIGNMGGEVAPDLSLEEINPEHFDGLVFVGGAGAANFINDPRAWKLVREFREKGKVVGAIQIAPAILANAGVLIGKRVTADFSQGKDLINKGSEYTGMSVEVDDKIVTGRDDTAAKEFGEKLAWELGK